MSLTLKSIKVTHFRAFPSP